MLSWASYLFGSGTTEPQPEEASPEPVESMEADPRPEPEPEQEWVVVDYAGSILYLQTPDYFFY